MATRNQSPASEIHLDRYYRNKNGESIQDIATKDDVDEATVKNSIRAIEIQRQRHDVQVLNESIVATVLDVVPEMRKSLSRQLRAKSGKKQDYVVQRGAVSEIRGLLQTVQPKAPSVHATQVNVGNAEAGSARIATGTYIGMEDRLKTITQQLETQDTTVDRKQLTQAKLEPIEEAVYEEDEEEDGEEEPVEAAE